MYCHLKVDTILESSDGIRYGTHAGNIEAFTGNFPRSPEANPNWSYIILLSESSDVIFLLLQYIHHQRHPDPVTFKFDILSQLADAAEKYTVFSAIEVCKIQMK
jgi:hypothetical protein